MTTPGDQLTREQLLEDLDSTFVVEAAAGTGKTTVLVGRIVRVVRTGRARLSQVIAVTFTEKAAGEMKLRLRERLEKEPAADAQERERLTQALEELEVARIGTIHGLCADLLREYPVEAGVDPLFEVAAESDADALLSASFQRVFQDLVRAPPEGIRRVLRRRPRGRDEDSPRRVLFNAVQQLIDRRDFTAPWRRDPFDRNAAIDAIVPRLEALADVTRLVLTRPDESSFLNDLGAVRRFCDDLQHREAVVGRDYDGLEAQLRDLGGNQYRWKSRPYRVQFEGLSNEQVLALRDEVYAALTELLRKADADVAALLHAELQPVVAAYEVEKARAGVLDFVDLLLKTRDLVRGNAAVRARLQERFTHLFVDEFQDTDPLQSELVLLLSSDDANEANAFATRPLPGKLFVVGDPKQSIYRFRRADVMLYERVKAFLVGHGAKLAFLSTSFRGTPGIQRAVNGAFERVMLEAGGEQVAGAPASHQASYVPLGQWREPYDKQPSVVALPAPRPFSEFGGRITKTAIEAHLPDAVAGFIEWLTRKSGWTVEENGQRVPVEARHVCILFKRLRGWGGADIPRPYARALEARRVPHVLVGGRSFHVREEVMALRTALLAIERPDDELSVFAVLRGPFFAFPDDQLLAFRHEAGRFHPLRPFEFEKLSTPSAEVAEALGELKKLHVKRNRRPVSATLHELLELTRAHAGVAFWTAGAQALANVLQLGELARRYERRATSFRDVVEALQDEADEGESPDAPIVEEGTEGVRMMTVHAAKGLEFPVVILAEPTANASRQEPSHWVDPERGLWVHSLAGCIPAELRDREAEVRQRDYEESVRVTYVAATRARDLLVVPAVSDRRLDGVWTEVLFPSLYPSAETAHAPKAAPGCPKFGDDCVLDRPAGVPPGVPVPGLHVAETKRNGVVWWDPATLELGREERTGLEAADALQDDPVEAPKSRDQYDAWLDSKGAALDAGLKPGAVVQVARELVEKVVPGAIALEQTAAARAGRPSGRRFGELVHAALAHVPLDAGRESAARVVEVHARSLMATPEEQGAAVEAVVAALGHPLFEAARKAKQVRRERAIVDVLEGGSFVEGSIDLAFDDGAAWTVVEFKTDDDLEAHRAAYEAQTAAYARAISGATGRPAKGVILRV